jgi:hypothetical protein
MRLKFSDSATFSIHSFFSVLIFFSDLENLLQILGHSNLIVMVVARSLVFDMLLSARQAEM